MNNLHPEVELAVEDCGNIKALEPFLKLVFIPGMYEELIAELNRKLPTPMGNRYSLLLSKIQVGNTCEVAETDLLPLLIGTVKEVKKKHFTWDK